MTTKTLLLDIDDCLSCDRSILVCSDFDQGSFHGCWVPRTGDRLAIDLINRACQICDAKVVVSSLWVAVAGPDYTLEWLAANGLRQEHLAPEPCVTYGSLGTKLQAIDRWSAQNQDIPASHVVVVDDDTAIFPRDHALADRQVVVDGEDGILLRHYREILAKLGATDPEIETL